MTNYECPKVLYVIFAQGNYQKTESHPNWEKIKECIKNGSLCS